MTGGLTALGAGLYSMGIARKSIVLYETEVNSGKILLILQGTAEVVERAQEYP